MEKKLPERKPAEDSRPETSYLLVHFFTQHFPRLFLSSLLFIGGIVLLSLRIPGWSIFLGLPATQIGLIFLIFTFDEMAKTRYGTDNLRHLSCSVCGQPTLAAPWQKEKVCHSCRTKISEEIKKEKEIRSSF